MTTAVLLVLSWFLWPWGQVSGASIRLCDNDSECEAGKFCFIETNVCTDCIQCSVYMRHEKKSGCAKEPSLCGECLRGYEAETFSDGRTRPLCTPMSQLPTTKTEPQPLLMAAEVNWQMYTIGVFVCATVACVAFLVKFRTQSLKVGQVTRHGYSCGALASLPSTIHSPTAPPAPSPHQDEEVSMCRVTDGVIVGQTSAREEEKCQMANVFLPPSYVRVPDETENNPGNEVPQDEIDGQPNVPSEDNEPFLIEENTLPSSWSPGPEYTDAESSAPEGRGTTSAPLVTSFQGILNLNGAAGSGAGSANHTATDDRGQASSQYNVTNITIINYPQSDSTGVFNMTNI